MKSLKKLMTALLAVVMGFGIVSFNQVGVHAATAQLEGAMAIHEIFPDATLARVVANQFGTNNTGIRVTQHALNTVQVLRYIPDGREMPGVPSARIESLEGMQYLTNVTYVALQANYITDITPLAGLTNMWYLNLSYNRITDLSPLAGSSMEWLRELYLQGNNITDYSALDHMTGLRHVVR